MRKPHFLDWDGRQVLAIYDGLHRANVEAIRSMKSDELCLFAGDFRNLTPLADQADTIERLTIASGVGTCDMGSLALLKESTHRELKLELIGGGKIKTAIFAFNT